MPRGRPRKVQDQVSVDLVQPIETQETAEVSEEVKESPTQPVAKRSGRPSRVPINGYRDILKVEGQEPGWHYSWITDENVFRMQDAGYVFVEHDVVVGNRRVNAASTIGSHISIPGGNGVTLFLMRCPNELYDEEMAILHKEIDDRERTMLNDLNSKEGGRYGSVKISRE